MYLSGIYEVLSIINNVSAIIKYKIFKINKKLSYRTYVKLFIKMIHGMSDPSKPIYPLHKLTLQDFILLEL